jgi:hypothetical protein
MLRELPQTRQAELDATVARLWEELRLPLERRGDEELTESLVAELGTEVAFGS